MTEEEITVVDEAGAEKRFPRKAVAIIKPVIELDDDDFAETEVE